MWLFYVALEPIVRRTWPGVLISWSRVLAGRLRDPLVGHHLLVGVLAGIIARSLSSVGRSMAVWTGLPPDMYSLTDLQAIHDVTDRRFNIRNGHDEIRPVVIRGCYVRVQRP